MGLMMPAASKVKNLAQSLSCKSNLRQLSIAFHGYVGDNNNTMPLVILMPSLGINEDPSYKRLCDILGTYVGSSNSKVFKCPADQGPHSYGVATEITDEDGNSSTSTNSSGSSASSDYSKEGSSYEFNEMLCGRKMKLLAWAMVMHDYRTYHGLPGTKGACNYVFEDGHVGDLNGR